MRWKVLMHFPFVYLIALGYIVENIGRNHGEIR
jgi:hypothetical protein